MGHQTLRVWSGVMVAWSTGKLATGNLTRCVGLGNLGCMGSVRRGRVDSGLVGDGSDLPVILLPQRQ
jgi:hypothetical protein